MREQTVRLLGLGAFTVLCCALIVWAGGGLGFLRRPVGATYLLLWALWWLVIALGRPRGVESAYDQSQFPILVLGIVVLVVLVVGPPWEYAHLAGPLPRDGVLAWLGSACSRWASPCRRRRCGRCTASTPPSWASSPAIG